MSNHKINELDSIFEESKLNDDIYEDEDGYYDEDEDGYYDELDKFDNNQKYTFDDEGFCIENGELIRYDGRDNKVRIPNSVKSINRYAFLKCYKIERIYIPSSVNSLPDLIIYSDLDLMDNEHLHIVIYCASPNIVIENSNISRVAIYSGVNKFNFFKASDFTFFIKEDEVILTKYLGNKEKVVIPSKVNAFGRTYKVTTIGKYAFSNKIREIVINAGVNSIDYNAFSSCDISLIYLENDVDLTKVDLSKETIVLTKNNNETRDDLNIYSRVNSDDYVFDGQSYYILSENYAMLISCLKSDIFFEIPRYIEYNNKKHLINKIGKNAFINKNLEKLKILIIGENVNTIEEQDFQYTSISNLIIPKNVQYIKSIRNNKFVLSFLNEKINDLSMFIEKGSPIDEFDTNFVIKKNYVNSFIKCCNINNIYYLLYDEKAAIAYVDISERLLDIPEFVEYKNEKYAVHRFLSYSVINKTNIYTISISKTIKIIEDYAFVDNYRLVQIVNKSTIKICCGTLENGGIGFFAKCIIDNIEKDKLMTDIFGYVYYWSKEEKCIIDYVGEKENIYLPDFNKEINYSINDYAFSNKKISQVIFSENIAEIRKKAFYSSDVNYVRLSKNIEIIGCGAFSFCNNLVQIDIPVESKLRKIESDAFEYCENLEDIELPDSLEYIGESAFYKCKHFRNINIPNNVKYIGDYCYEGCIRLSNITFDSFSQLEHIGNRVFSNCQDIIDIDDIPGSVLYVGESAFSDCLANITVEDPSKIVNWHPNWIDRCFYDSRGNIYDSRGDIYDSEW